MTITNLQLLEGAVEHLSALLGEVVFVGGVTVELWVTDPGSPPLRLTADVDVIAEISTRQDYYRLEDRVRELGIRKQSVKWSHLPVQPQPVWTRPRCDADQGVDPRL